MNSNDNNDIKKGELKLYGAEKVDPSKRADVAYANYRTLLATSRAVWVQKTHVWVRSAGHHPETTRLTCASKREARRFAAALFTDLKQAKSDDEYNRILMTILRDIQQAPKPGGAAIAQAELHDVHTCETGQQCTVTPEGVASCGFNWSHHTLGLECRCNPTLDDQDASGKYHFIVHRDLKGKVFV